MTKSFYKFVGTKLRPVELRLFIKWLLRIKRKSIILPDGREYEVDPISDLGIKIMNGGEYEAEMTKLIASTLSNGDSFIDLGANEGYFSVLAGIKCGNKGKVYSIEPQKDFGL
jgi:hypothetical protein